MDHFLPSLLNFSSLMVMPMDGIAVSAHISPTAPSFSPLMATTKIMQRRRTVQRTALILVVLLGVSVADSKSIIEMGLPEDELPLLGRHLLRGRAAPMAGSMAASQFVVELVKEINTGPSGYNPDAVKARFTELGGRLFFAQCQGRDLRR